MSKIFNIGFNKAGTTSLTEAMTILGYRGVHYRVPEGELVTDVIVENRKNGRKLLEGIDHYEFYSDFRGNKYYKELDEQYPNSKFILTVRDIDDWLLSREKHVIRNQKNPNYKGRFNVVDKEKWIEDRESLVKELDSYFSMRKNDYLVIDVCGKDGWKELCGFLHVVEPEENFPSKNLAANF